MKKLDYVLQMIQLYSYKLPTVKIGNWIMDFRSRYTLRQGEQADGFTN